VDRNENYEWRANVAAIDDVFVDPSHPPVKGEATQCPEQGCQMVYLYSKYPNFGQFWKVLKRNIFMTI
jgi:hypothetical protein